MRNFFEGVFSVKKEYSYPEIHFIITNLVLKIKKLIKSKHTVHCYYFQAEPNFGDLLNVSLFKKFGLNIHAGKIKNSQIVAIGSLLQTFFQEKSLSCIKKYRLKYQKAIIVYGSGFIEDIPASLHLFRKLEVKAVRGYFSLEKLKKFKSRDIKISQNAAIGDPGLLAKYLIDVSNIEKKFDLGIIPHYVDKNNLMLNNIKVQNSIIIDIQQKPEVVLRQIAECKNIISSSLHGLIVSDSLGIPNIRMIISDKITGGDYKFNDYYSAFGIKKHKVINLSKQTFSSKDIADIAKNYNIKPEQVEQICMDLIRQFPFYANQTA